MSVTSVAMKAYTQALEAQRQAQAQQVQQVQQAQQAHQAHKVAATEDSGFAGTLTSSLQKVNELQLQSSSMVESFASGENQNVHELMIHLQKASLAVNMTSAVRNKIMSAYQDIMRMPL